jgi:hypothetical protein
LFNKELFDRGYSVIAARAAHPRFPTVEFLELEHGHFHRVPSQTKITPAKVNLEFTINVGMYRNPVPMQANSDLRPYADSHRIPLDFLLNRFQDRNLDLKTMTAK